MNLYFLDSKGKETLINENATQETIVSDIRSWLKKNKPECKCEYSRHWVDDHGRYWVDFGSWEEFFIIHEPYKGESSNECEVCRID